jgi:hypothetical protein
MHYTLLEKFFYAVFAMIAYEDPAFWRNIGNTHFQHDADILLSEFGLKVLKGGSKESCVLITERAPDHLFQINSKL